VEDLGIGGRIILKRILNRKGGYAMVYCGLGKRQMTGCFECGNELSDSLKDGDFLTNYAYWLFKTHSASLLYL
jgi:hypothetical protein